MDERISEWARLTRKFGGPVYPVYRGAQSMRGGLLSVYLGGGRGFKKVTGLGWSTWPQLLEPEEFSDVDFPGGVQ